MSMKTPLHRYRLLSLLILLVMSCAPATAWATCSIQSLAAVDITLTGFDGLKDVPLLQGRITPENPRQIDTPYRGLALLGFAGGQSYPVIIGDTSFAVTITSPAEPPNFTDSGENDYLYQALAGSRPASIEKYPFVDLLFAARELLESTYTISTLTELAAKKNQLNTFVAANYQNLRHSDMLRRLMNQSLMMHEYVPYRIEGEPATAIQQRYQEEVLAGVGSWLKTLSPHIPADQILNACVALYYERSMVAMAALMINRFSDAAFCPGETDKPVRFADDLTLSNGQGTRQARLTDLEGEKTIALVADDCPVSMVAAVVKARELAKSKAATPLIVAPMPTLKDTHRAMARMIRDEQILFINDEKWFREQPAARPRLPLLIESE